MIIWLYQYDVNADYSMWKVFNCKIEIKETATYHTFNTKFQLNYFIVTLLLAIKLIYSLDCVSLYIGVLDIEYLSKLHWKEDKCSTSLHISA